MYNNNKNTLRFSGQLLSSVLLPPSFYNIALWMCYSTVKHALYLFIFVEGHELDGSIRKNPDHHCPVTLVQAAVAFFLWHSSESGKHSCKGRSQVSLMRHRSVKTNTYWPFRWYLYLDVCNEHSGLEGEFWLCPEERWLSWHSILQHLNKNRARQHQHICYRVFNFWCYYSRIVGNVFK